MAAPEIQNGDQSVGFQLHLVIVGAGLAGLAAAISARLEGHRVTLLERADQLVEVGAGLQVTPNATRLFHRWGVFDELRSKAAVPSYLAVRRYDGSRLLAYEDRFQEKIIQSYDAPFWDLHRADLQLALVHRAQSLGVNIRLGADVAEVDPQRIIVTTKSGERVQGDLILGADGLWSRTRNVLVQPPLMPKPTGDLAYRIILDLEDIKDPELQKLVSNPSVNFWVGPHSHVVGYSVRQGRTYNLVLLRPDDLPKDVPRASANVEEMRSLFENWDPTWVEHPYARLSTTNRNNIAAYVVSTLDTWANSEGTFLLAGDACHPMLPYLAQGANSSLEDGAVLGRLLKYVTSREKLPSALEMYQQLRKSRGETIAKEALEQRASFHMEDGPLQEERDAIFLENLGKVPDCQFPSRWTCPSVQPWLYGYDAVAEADKAYKAHPF
ncbi:hypothetical protein EYZ11_010884 [Aspergillus tanneri]|uniref:FAD-binding domain-containing protein n=1 Tax=Aspergillus tanneri TaxID=1220188 RepID=A0A4S3J480_9EURO|nr:hypothetical protein EYZ11_010884 [Aspergillus tanneri]